MFIALTKSTYYHFGTTNPNTGEATNADSTPIVNIAEDGVTMAYTPVVTSVSTGLYKVQIDVTGANGFEAGRMYSVFATAVVGGITGKDGLGQFEVITTDVETSLGRLDTTVSSRSTLTAPQVRTELSTELARLDVAISSRLASASYTAPDNAGITAIKWKTDQFSFTGANVNAIAQVVSDKTGYSLTSAERTAIAVAVEQSILNEWDGQAILNAIVGAIGNQNIDVIALVGAIRADLERTGWMMDTIPTLWEIEGSSVLAKEATVSSRASQTSINAIPTNPLLTNDVRLDYLDAPISGAGGSSGGLSPEQEAKLTEIHERIDVKLSSRASIKSVHNLEMNGGFTKEDREKLQNIEKIATTTDGKVDTVQSTLESLTDTIIENFTAVRSDLENMTESGKSLIDSGKKTLDAIEKIEIIDHSEELKGIKADIMSSIEKAEDSNIKLIQLLGMTSSGMVKDFAELLKNGFFDMKVSMEKEKKETSLISSKSISEVESKLMEHVSLGIKYLSDRIDSFDRKLEEVGAKDFTIHIENDE